MTLRLYTIIIHSSVATEATSGEPNPQRPEARGAAAATAHVGMEEMDGSDRGI